MGNARTNQVLEITKRFGVVRPRDLDAAGLPRVYLSRLHDRKLIQRVGRGLYMATDLEVTENHTLAEACKRVPNGIVCLLSALQYHRISTQSPFEIWMAIDRKARLPLVDRPAMHFVRFSGRALVEGIEEKQIEGVTVKVYNPAKTVADCFKYRNKIGIDVALEALRNCLRTKKCSADELSYYAKVCRVEKIMKPYLEAIL